MSAAGSGQGAQRCQGDNDRHFGEEDLRAGDAGDGCVRTLLVD